MNSVDLHESGSYRKTRQGGARSPPPPPPPIPFSLLLSKYLRYRTRARANSMAKVQKTETRNSRARDISGYRSTRIHGRNDFSSRWKLVEKRGGLSRRKPRAGHFAQWNARSGSSPIVFRGNERSKRTTLLLQSERIKWFLTVKVYARIYFILNSTKREWRF